MYSIWALFVCKIINYLISVSFSKLCTAIKNLLKTNMQSELKQNENPRDYRGLCANFNLNNVS